MDLSRQSNCESSYQIFESNWGGSQQRAAKWFRVLLLDQNSADAAIVVRDEIFRCHKTVLAINSEYFFEIISENPSATGLRFHFDNCSTILIHLLMDFMYRGSAAVPPAYVDAFSSLMDDLKIDSVRRSSHFPIPSLESNTCLQPLPQSLPLALDGSCNNVELRNATVTPTRSRRRPSLKERKYKKYSEEHMQAAVSGVLARIYTVAEACKKFNVPSRTLYQKLNDAKKYIRHSRATIFPRTLPTIAIQPEPVMDENSDMSCNNSAISTAQEDNENLNASIMGVYEPAELKRNMQAAIAAVLRGAVNLREVSESYLVPFHLLYRRLKQIRDGATESNSTPVNSTTVAQLSSMTNSPEEKNAGIKEEVPDVKDEPDDADDEPGNLIIDEQEELNDDDPVEESAPGNAATC